MELVKNKASGRFFVVLDDDNGSDFLLVTPEGKVKRLERHLFGPIFPIDPPEMKRRYPLTQEQVDIYTAYSGS